MRFPVAVFAATLLLMALQKPIFLLYYAREAAEAGGVREWLQVVWHGLSLDMTVAGYVTALPLLAVIASLWISIPERVWRPLLNGYFVVVSLLTAAIFAVDTALYAHWGFRIDSTILIYLADPKEAAASVDLWTGVRQTLLFVAWAAGMIWLYRRVVPLFDGGRLAPMGAAAGTLMLLLLGGFDFLAIRGGVGASVANVSKVCFSPKTFLNHAAINPLFSLLSTLGNESDYAAEYPFFEEAERAAKFEALRGNGAPEGPAERVLRCERPNVVLIILESFARSIMAERVDGRPVMPRLEQLRDEGIWFENFYANSFRTDRGEVAILSGFPAQTRISIMKLPTKCSSLPSLARSLGQAGYSTEFCYGGDLNFTNQASYMYATGWQRLVWMKELSFPARPGKWGWHDDVMCDWFAERVIARSREEGPFLEALLTLSSHAPFDVPYDRFDDEVLNAVAFTDESVGRLVDRLKGSPAWENLLVVLVADHGYPYPRHLAYNSAERHHIPMIWTGGAVEGGRTVETYASQIDLCATLLAQLGIGHTEFDYSKDIFSGSTPKFGYWAFNDGFGVIDASGCAVWDNTTGTAVEVTNPALLDVGRTMLQTTYVDIQNR